MGETAGIGHNGGPKPRLGRKLSDSQARALTGIRDHGNGFHGRYGRSQSGGYNNVEFWLHKEALSTRNAETGKDELTERGTRVIEAGRMVD